MIKQDERLNSVPLEEAAKIISNEVIRMRFTLDEELKELERQHEQYQNDFIKANDGDASENAPLDEARKNLRLNMGETVSKLVLIQKMDKIDEATYVIGTYNYDNIKLHYDSLSPESRECINSYFEAQNQAEFIQYIKECSRDKLVVSLESLIKYVDTLPKDCLAELHLMDELVKFYQARKKPKYNRCGIISIYTTVRLKYNGSIVTFAIYPTDISFIDIGVMAANSRLSSVLLGKCAGDIVSLPNSSTSDNLDCEILEVY